jgi:copper oxidase (laccase) domain-containing protein
MVVATADCVPVVLAGPGGAGIAHAGWRGAAAGVVAALRSAMEAAGTPPRRAAVGPGIGPCCFEVGPDVADRFPGFTSTTRAGTTGVHLAAALAADLDGLDVWEVRACTACGDGYHSYRRDGTDERQVALAWLPED